VWQYLFIYFHILKPGKDMVLLQIVNGTYFYMITSVFRDRDNVHGIATR
jgi:hypothetical protein